MHLALSLIFTIIVLATLGAQSYAMLRRMQVKLLLIQVLLGAAASGGGVLKIYHLPLPSLSQILVALVRTLGVST